MAITKLTTFKYQLPQDFPTSPIPAALVIEPARQRLRGFAERYDVMIGIYADNLVMGRRYDFSTRLHIVEKVFHNYGFVIVKFKAMSDEIKREIIELVLLKKTLHFRRSLLCEVPNVTNSIRFF